MMATRDKAMMNPYRNIAEILSYSAEKYPHTDLWGTKVDGTYRWITYSDFEFKVRRLRAALHHLGIQKGDRIGIISRNSEEWACVAYAAYGLGAVIVPMYEVQKQTDWEYILNNSEACCLFAANERICSQIEELHIPSIKHIFSFSVSSPDSELSFAKLMENETEYLDIQPGTGDKDISDIIYTSGTTGTPKGVVLTHEGIITNVIDVRSCFELSENDCTLSFLPWAHAFGKTVELHLFVSVGSAIGLAESSRTIAQNMLEVNPTILIGVPKIFNKFYEGIQRKFSEMPMVLKSLMNRTQKLSHKHRRAKLSIPESLQFRVLDTFLAEKVRSVFGNRLRFCITGGAALSSEVIEFFDDFGVLIYEGYGMTEVSPVVSVNYAHNQKMGSVGKPTARNKVTIEPVSEHDAERGGEVVVHGPCVMKEYYQSPEANAEVFTEDGGLRTGDMGYLDEDGYLWLTGRVKEQYKLENGKYVVPGALEKTIVMSSMIENAVIFGDGKPFNVVLIQLSADFLKSYAAEHNVDLSSPKAIETNAGLREAVQKELDEVCKDFRGYERPQKFEIVGEEFTIQNGLMTPALKVKRKAVAKKYEDKLNAMFKK